MKLRERLASWLLGGSRAFAPPAYRFGTFRQGITQTESQPSPDLLLVDAMKGNQATAARAVANRLGSLSWEIARRRRADTGEAEFELLPAHPLVAVLDRPAPMMTRLQLLRLTAYWIQLTGDAYWLKVTNGAGAVRELWPMSPRNVERVAGDASPVSAFVFHGERGETRYRTDEVVWISNPDPAYPFQGLGVIGPQARRIDAATFADATLREHFQNDATPKTVLLAKEEARFPDPEQRKLFESDWVNRYSRLQGSARSTPAFLPSGFDLRELTGGAGVSDTVPLLEFLRDDVLMALGTPRSILGDVVDANRAAAETNALVFDLHTIKPLADLVADAVTYQLVQPDHGLETFARFAEFVSEDREFRLKEEAQDLTLKVRTINEVRTGRGLDPVEWGDLPIGTFGDVPYTGEEREPVDALPPQPGEPVDDPDAAASSSSSEDGEESDPVEGRSYRRAHPAAAFTPALEWSRVLQRDRAWVPLMVSRLRRVFAAQRAQTLEALEKEGAPLARAWSRTDELDEVFDGADFRRLFDLLVTPVRIDAAQASRQNALQLLQAKPSLTFTDKAVKLLERQGADLVTAVNATTKRRIRDTLAKGVTDGDSLSQLSARVRKVFSDASSLRARTIARTEVLQAVQFGQLEGYRDSGVVVGKRWNTAQDDRVRDSHEIDGQAVETAGTFTLGDGEAADAPGLGANGARLSAGNAINCRCFITPVLEGDL